MRKVKASYRGRRVSIEHPKGQYGLLREFIPGEPVSTSAYRRRLPALYLAAGVPTASSQLGDRRGPYVGYTAGSSRRAVMFDTHYATEVQETSGLVPVVGGLGAGKSVLLGQITYEAVRRGVPSVVLDPSGPLARLTELPELRGHSEHLDLTTAASGTLNPFDVVARPDRSSFAADEAFEEAQVLAAQDRKLLAMDVVKMLLPPSVDAIPDTSLVVSDAVRATKGDQAASLWDVVENLERQRSPHGRVVANYLRDMAELPLARLFFPSPGAVQERLEATLTVLTMPGLVLPPRSVPRDHWSTSEQLAVPLLHLASWYATRAVYGREHAEPQARRPRRDPLPRRVVRGPGAVHPPRSRLAQVEHLRPRRLAEPVRRARHGRRELHVRGVRRPASRTRTPRATVCGCCGSRPASATSGRWRTCRRAAARPGSASS